MFRKITSIAAALATTATLAVAAVPANADNDIQIGNRSQFVQSGGTVQARPQTLAFKPGRLVISNS
jgi:hypothetical protein